MAPAAVRIESYQVCSDARRPYATYTLVVSQSNASWTLTRRWNDLRRAMDQLSAGDHAAQLAEMSLPVKFEPHGWRSSTAMLEPAFLEERAANMAALLNTLLAGFDVNFALKLGPPSLLELLSAEANPQPGADSTPRGTPHASPAKPADAPVRLGHPVESAAGDVDRPRTRRALKMDDVDKVAEGATGDDEAGPGSSAGNVLLWTVIALLPLALIVFKELIVGTLVSPPPTPSSSFFS